MTTTAQAPLSPLSSLNPESLLGYLRTFLEGREGTDRQQEALSLLDAITEVEGCSTDELLLTERVLERIGRV